MRYSKMLTQQVFLKLSHALLNTSSDLKLKKKLLSNLWVA